jgi:hypothetical protein
MSSPSVGKSGPKVVAGAFRDQNVVQNLEDPMEPLVTHHRRRRTGS